MDAPPPGVVEANSVDTIQLYQNPSPNSYVPNPDSFVSRYLIKCASLDCLKETQELAELKESLTARNAIYPQLEDFNM